MKKALYIIIMITIFMASSCTKKGIIPRDTLSNIYYDLYLADQLTINRDGVDTLLVYEPIFNKYGYTTEDYINTSNYYLQKPEKFAKIFKATQSKYKKRKEQLEQLIAIEEGKNFRWKLLDSLEVLGSSERNGNAYYRTLNLIFFVPDTIPITSPVIDSAIISNVENAFFLYDSLTIYDGDISILLPQIKEVKVKKTSSISNWKSRYGKTSEKKNEPKKTIIR